MFLLDEAVLLRYQLDLEDGNNDIIDSEEIGDNVKQHLSMIGKYVDGEILKTPEVEQETFDSTFIYD